MIRSIKILFLLVFIFTSWQSGFGAGKIDSQRMKKDLNMMSMILDKLLNPENDLILRDGNTRAVYLEGHGVLFIYRKKMSFSHIIISDSGDEFLSDNYREQSSQPKRAPGELKKSKDGQCENSVLFPKQIEVNALTSVQKISETKTKLGEFLGDYCGVIKHLKPTEQITVIVISENSMVFRFNQAQPLSHQPKAGQLVASVSVGDITAYRRNSINQAAFLKRINIRNDVPGAQVDKDLQIMSNIFSVALQQNKDSDLVFSNDISGVYLQNFGVLFMLNFQRNFKTKILQVKTDYENLLSIINEEEEHLVKKGKELLDKIEQSVVDVLADYGHNLRQLNDKEWIGVAVDLKRFPGMKEDPSSLFFKVRKKDAVAINQGKINAKKFKARVIVTSY